MADLSRALVGALTPRQDSVCGVVATLSPLTVTIGGGTVEAVSEMAMWAHAVGEPVVCQLNPARNQWRIVATRQTRPQWATVATVTGLTAVVVDDAGAAWSVTISGAVPAVGAKVIVGWGPSGGVILSVQTGAATPPAAPPSSAPLSDSDPAPGPVQRGYTLIPAIATGTYRGGALRTDSNAASWLYQGHWTTSSLGDNSGAFFYGSGFAAAPAGAVATSARIWLGRVEASVGVSAARPVHLWLHTARTRTGSPPTVTGAEYAGISLAQGQTPTGDPDGWAFPTAMAQQLLDGTAAGISIVHAGTADYMALRGLSGVNRHAQAGQIRIDHTSPA